MNVLHRMDIPASSFMATHFNTAGSIEVHQEESHVHNMANKDESELVPSSSKGRHLEPVSAAVKALKDHEDKLVASFEGVNLVSLARFGSERGFISQDVKESLESMDPNVHWPTKIRYLFLHVYESLQRNPRLYERWLKLLSEHGASSEALEQVRLSYALEQARLSSEEYCARESVSGGVNAGVVVGTKRPHKYDHFYEQHVSVLTEILANHCHKWNEIGTSLNLPYQLLRSIRGKMHLQEFIICLNDVLREWIIGNHEHAKPPTVKSLEETLHSKTVGLGSEANKLQENLRKLEMCFTSEVSASKRPCLEVTPLEVLSRTCDCNVSEEKSALLEVQVSANHETTITYRWMKDGAPLSDDSTYCGTHKQILCINDVTMASEGIYHCAVQTHENEKLQSEPIKLTVIVPPEKRTLIDRYLSQPEVPEDTWPPVSNDTYINLALIKQSEINKAGEYAYKTIQGDIDDILKDKEKIEYNEVFSHLETGARLFIEGRPGSGKTTLVHKVSRDWAKNKLQLDSIRLLFLVHLRGFFNDPDIQLTDILKRYYKNESSVSSIISHAESNSGEGLCFILDGLDEYSPKKKNETMIFQLIKKNILPKSVVIVASRPAAVAQLKKVATKRVEVLGFEKEQIFQYIEKYKFSSTKKSGDLLSYLDQHPNVKHMCYLPIHTAMVCYLFEVLGHDLPRTETKMYTKFTNHTLFRTIKCCEEHNPDTELSADLPEQEKKTLYFHQICQLAYEKTIHRKQYMKHNEVKDFFEGVKNNRESLGLINVDRISEEYGYQGLYTFLHLTFQEYLAAYHISQLKEEEQTKVIKTYGKKKHMQVVWKFYCGLDVNLTKFEELMKLLQDDDLFQIQCAFESQQSIICDSVIQSGEECSLTFKNRIMTPSDLTALGYVISNASVKKLVLNRCKIGGEEMDAFLKEAEDKVSSIITFCFHGGDCRMRELKVINVLLKELTSLITLDISDTALGPQKVKALTSGIHLTNLKKLELSDFENLNCIQELFDAFNLSVLLPYFHNGSLMDIKYIKLANDEIKLHSGDLEHCTSLKYSIGAKALAEGLKHCMNLQMLDLFNNTIDTDGVRALAEGLKHCMNLQTLNLQSNSIRSNGAKALAKGLKHCTNLQTLDLCSNSIRANGAKALAKGLKHCTNLQTLDLNNNSIDADGAKALAEGIKHCTNLQTLNLKSNSIGVDGAKALAEGIKCCTNLQTLNLQSNSIGVYGAKALAEGLKHCTNLQTLDLYRNSIGGDGTMALAEGIKCCTNLQTLNLQSNSIGVYGAKALAEGLKHCTNLQTLNLYRNSIGDDGTMALAEGLKHCTNLQTLDLYRNSIGDHGTMALAEGLKHCTNLQTLNLESNSIGVDGTKALAEGLKHCTNLQTLNLESNSIGADGTKALAEGLKHCTNLQTLNLESNSIGVYGAKALAEGLKHCTNLQTLDLYRNSIGDDGTMALAEGLKHCTNLQMLNLKSNSIGDDGTKALAEGLKHCTNLQTLNLESNSIGVDGTKALAEGLKHCTNLQTLNLQSNSIGVYGAKALAEGLKHCTNLQTLDLYRNSIGDDGTMALAEGLKHCTNLQTLNLRNNSIGGDGAKALVEGLKHCMNLQTLNLSDNSIGSGGAMALAECLKHCTNLQTLGCSGNSIGYHGINALAEGQKHCTNLDLKRNNISVNRVKIISKRLKHCKNLKLKSRFS